MNFFDVFCPDKRKPSVTVRLLCATLYSITPVAAQNRPLAPDELIVAIKRDLENNPPKTIVKPSDTSVPLGAVTTPDGELWTEQNGYRVIRNVTQPALYPVRPTPDSANGTAVVIAPGGGFMSLAFDTEGMLVAKQLAAHGVTCFVLKYRLLPTPSDTLGYAAMIAENVASMDPNTINVPIGTARLPLSAQEDGLAAMRWVREHAKEFGISRERIGMLGFSAGGATTMAVATAYDATTRPDFIGVVYG